MTQDELDRVLEEALGVEPPAGYVARVRARVAVEQARPGGHTWRPLAALAASVLVVVTGGLILERADDSPVRVGTTTSRAPGKIEGGGTPVEATSVPAVAPAGDPRRTAPARHQPGAVTASTASAEQPLSAAPAFPTVLISPDDAAGPRLLATYARAGLAAPAFDSGEREAPLQVGRIDVSPIQVDSLPVVTPLVIGELQ